MASWTPREILTDVLVVGSGGAALRAVLDAREAGADVLVVIKGQFGKSGATFHSVAEVGAFNVPDGAGDPQDNPDVFYGDMMTAAQEMADGRLCRILADEAQGALAELEQAGVNFEREDGRYLVFRACFSSRPRSHVLLNHFKPIVAALGAQASRQGVRVLDRTMVVNLIVRGGQCHGVYAIDADGSPVVIRAKSTILTTGGASQLFGKNLYPSDITGDGYAMAYRAGAWLTNMEFMQAGVSVISPFINLFGNYLWDARPNLTDRDGRPFVDDYLPRGLTLEEVLRAKERHFPFSSSDVSRYIEISIQKTINEGRGTPEGGVYMDFAGRNFERILADPATSIAKMWPHTYAWYKERGVDLYRDKIQIACSGHAVNGGLYIDEDAQSNVAGLFAAGEVAAGPHGADRLGGNMALTCQVFGRRAGRAAARRAKSVDHERIDCIEDEFRSYVDRFGGHGTQSLNELRAALQRAADQSLLVVRNETGLRRFLDVCSQTVEALENDARIKTAEDRILALELVNLAEVGALMATAARERKESRGGHYREDYPEPDTRQATNVILDRADPVGCRRARLCDLSDPEKTLSADNMV